MSSESSSQSVSSPTTTSSSTEASDSAGTEQVSSPSPPASASPPPPASASPPPPASTSPPPPASSSPPPPASSSPPPPASSSPPPPAATKSPPPPASTSPPPPSPSTSPPPPASTPPPATPPPPAKSSPPPPSPTSPPPAPPTSTPPPPSSNPPPATPETSETPPPPASSASPPPPSPPSATPSPPLPEDAPPLQNPPPNAASLPPPPPQAKPASAETPPKAIPSPNPPRSTGSSSSPNRPPVVGGVIAGIVIGGLLIIVLLIVIICLMCKKKRKPQYYMDPNGKNQYYSFAQQDLNISGEFGSMPVAPSTNMGGINHFSYEELAAATNGFSQSNLLGQGGFGLVHKGVLPDKREVAVKSLKSGSGQGEREFQAEVEIISRVHHRHLVSLVGYCIAADKKLLVYEYVPNKTMEFHLHGKDQAVLDWPTRLRIAIGSAKGLAYLHEDCLPRIIHRDIKAANILIDNNYEAMVADFGLAKLTTDNNTHVSTRVMGTFGYLAPEYASSGKLSEKSDVFSFGVMLLELITGKRPIDLTNNMEDSLVEWARPLLSKALEDGNYEELVDSRLQGNYLHHELARMATCAAASIRHSARKRPKMSQIVRALEGDSSMEDLNEGVKPGQSGQYNPNGGSDIYDTRAYNADMLKFKKMVMSSQEFNSSEYGTTTTSDTD